MRNALGFLIILWGLQLFFSNTFSQFDDTATATLRAIGTAADVSRESMLESK